MAKKLKKKILLSWLLEHPFSNKTWNTCAVLGNGGILSDSNCGEKIDSAQFVIRCNLPPISNGYEEHVGSKTDLVTANPSILTKKYESLTERRRASVERLHPYGNVLLLLPTFALNHDTAACQRAIYTIEDFESPMRPISFNPKYLRNLSAFWRSQGLRSRQMSSGIIMAILALEVCENVLLYGFWPSSSDPFELYDLTHHYYDNNIATNKVHTMPSEFKFLLKLHSQGVFNLHLQNCHHGETDPRTADRTKEHPFSHKKRDTCAVIGNGGILANSSCGDIDSAEFVIRCNLPPLENGYEKDVGIKTDLVTTNPTILNKKYEGLMKYRHPFVEDLSKYGRSLILLGPFSFAAFKAVSLRAAYTIEDFRGPTQSVLLNPEYHRSLGVFWRKQGLTERRLTTRIIMVSLALELCENVHLFRFWPFNNHPHGLYNLKHHYYDDVQPKTSFHAMPAEFELLLQLHNQGVLRLHLEDC